MKKKALHKNAWKEIFQSKARFLSILGIILLGVAFFAGIKATGPDMKDTANRYYQDLNYHDLSFNGSLGLSDEDLNLLENVKDIEEYEPYYQEDAKVKDENKVVRIFDYDTTKKIDNVKLEKGRLPEKENEIVVDYEEYRDGKYQLKDTISFLDTSLKNNAFTIVGFVNSPLYVERASRGNTNVGKGSLDFFALVPKENFPNDFYAGVRLTFKNPPKEVYSNAYDEFMEEKKSKIEKLFANRPKNRLEEIKKTGQEKITSAKIELDKGQKKLDDGKTALEKAKKELEDGKSALEKGKGEVTATFATKKQEIKENEEKLQAGQQTIDKSKTELSTKETALQKQEDQLKESEKQVEEQLNLWPNYEEQIKKAIVQLEDSHQKMSEGLKMFQQLTSQEVSEGNTKTLQIILNTLSTNLTNLGNLGHLNQLGNLQLTLNTLLKDVNNKENQQTFAKSFEKLIAEVETIKGQTQEQLTNGKQKLIDSQNKIKDGLSQIQEGKLQIKEGEKKLLEEETNLNKQKAALKTGKEELLTQEKKALENLKTQEETLENGQKEYEKNAKTFQEEKAKNEKKLADGKKELATQEANLKNLSEPTYYFFTRKDQVGFSEYGENAQRITNISTVFPVFFFLIAVLVTFTTMVRMVEEKRGEIGILKSLGYRSIEIAYEFVLYAGLSGVFGMIFGLLAGNYLFPKVIFDAYSSMYNLSGFKVNWFPVDILIAFVVTVGCTIGSAMVALYLDMRDAPAYLMLPKAPKAGQKILLERIPFIWKRLSFTKKVTVRNLLRYKARGTMTILGVAGCMALMLTGFGLKNSVGDISELQFHKLWHYQAIVTFKENRSEEEEKKYDEKLKETADIKEKMPVSMRVLDKESKEVTKQNVTIYTPQYPDEIKKFVSFNDRKSKKPYSITDDGALVSEKFASLFHLKKGDSFKVEDSDQKEFTFKVGNIVENYAMHFLYISPTYYEKVFNEKPKFNSEFLTFGEMSKDREEQLSADLMNTSGVINVSFISDTSKMMEDAMGSLTIVIWVLIISAAALAFIVLYNLTNINISERIRELSTIKVLGFYDREVTMYIYHENIILTTIGVLLGGVFGVTLHQYVLQTVEVDKIMFGSFIHWQSYVYSALLTLFFSALVMVFMHFKIKRVDMIEALKSNE